MTKLLDRLLLNKEAIQYTFDSSNTFPLEKHIILLGFRGSVSHNLYLPKDDSIDDIDLLGVIIPPKEYYFGLHKFEQVESFKVGSRFDLVAYEIRKFFRLMSKMNPNVMSMLWLCPEHYLIITDLGQKILDNRCLFSSKQCYNTFCGYAYGQLKRMTHFQKYEGYMGKKRKQLVDKFGYDVKNASHLIRILTMGIEFLKTRELNVYRYKDREILLDIKNGKWSLEKVKEKAEILFKDLEKAKDDSSLPDKTNSEQINKLLIEIVENYFQKEKLC